MSTATTLTLVVLLGVLAQWAAARLRTPSILVLLMAGFLAGPISGFLNPDELLGDLLFPVVSLSVAIILFEGALSLGMGELQKVGSVVRNLLTVGVVITWGLSALCAYYVLQFDAPMSALLGAILTVTGPTVILPMLRHIRLNGQSGSILKWEGIVVDPIGAVLAILVFEAIVAGPEGTVGHTALGILKTVLIGGGFGAAAALLLTLALRRDWVPETLHNPLSLMTLLTAFALSNEIQHESGLLAVTVMGFMLANQTRVPVRHIVEFKETLGTLLIATLFIVLAARIEIATLMRIDWRMFVFLGALLFVVRPTAVFLSTIAQDVSWKERLFLSWMAPRGIVAAAVSSILALDLVRKGYPKEDGQLFVATVFFVIVGTVAVYGITARPLAQLLGLAGGERRGILIVGAHDWAREIAAVVQEKGIPVQLIDTNTQNVSTARLQGLEATTGNVLNADDVAELDLTDTGRLFALTSNDEVNSLAALNLIPFFGRANIYQISPYQEADQRSSSVPRDLRGRSLFNRDLTFRKFSELYVKGWRMRATRLTKEFGYEQLKEHYHGRIHPLLSIADGVVTVFSTERRIDPRTGQLLISLAAPEEKGERG